MFQYSFCSYSTGTIGLPCCNMVWFQYSFCSYSTYTKYTHRRCTTAVSIQLLFLFNHCGLPVEVKLFLFQYSFCSYSTYCGKRRIIKRFVSIQLLFLFNHNLQTHRNTSRMFQYSFCSYSTF